MNASLSSFQLEEFITSYIQKFNELTSKFKEEDKILLLPRHLRKSCKIIGTISKTHGAAIEFMVGDEKQIEKQIIEINYGERTIEDVVLPKLSIKGMTFFVVQGTNNVLENINLVTKEFYEKHKELIDRLSRSTNLIMENVQRFVEIKSGDIKLIDVTLAYLENGRDVLRKIDCIWLFGTNSSSSFSKEVAKSLAIRDYQEIVSIAMGKVPVRLLIGTLNEYWKLLNKREVSEEELQQFFENNWIILDVNARRIFPKYRLGEKFIADFLIETSDFKYIAVEIEKPTDELYTHERPPRQRRKLREADAQVKEILSYMRNNILYLRKDFPFMTAENVRGLIVIGRSDRLSEEHKRRLMQDNAYSKEYEIVTFDQLFERAQMLLENLGIRYSPFG